MIGIGRTTQGSRKAFNYIQNDKGQAQGIDSNKIVGDNAREIYWEMSEVASRNKHCKNSFYNVVLSPNPEKVKYYKKEDWEKLSKDFCKKMNIDKNQYVAYLHTSTKTPHLHIIANRINAEGKCTVKAHNIDKQTQKVAEKLAKERNWETAKEAKIERLKEEGLNYKEDIKKDLNICIKESTNREELNKKMLDKGYTMKWNERNGETIGLRVVPTHHLEWETSNNKERKANKEKPIYNQQGFKLSEIDRKVKVKDIEQELTKNRLKRERKENVIPNKVKTTFSQFSEKVKTTISQKLEEKKQAKEQKKQQQAQEQSKAKVQEQEQPKAEIEAREQPKAEIEAREKREQARAKVQEQPKVKVQEQPKTRQEVRAEHERKKAEQHHTKITWAELQERHKKEDTPEHREQRGESRSEMLKRHTQEDNEHQKENRKQRGISR